MCLKLVDERGYKGSGLQNKGIGLVFNECMHELSRLSMLELTRKTQLFGIEVAAWRPTRTAGAQ
jgi:hypothetical protein